MQTVGKLSGLSTWESSVLISIKSEELRKQQFPGPSEKKWKKQKWTGGVQPEGFWANLIDDSDLLPEFVVHIFLT